MNYKNAIELLSQRDRGTSRIVPTFVLRDSDCSYHAFHIHRRKHQFQPAKTVDSLFKSDGSTCRDDQGTVQNLPYSWSPCYIVQGSNELNPIKVKVEQKRFSQSDLETAISNTDNSNNAVFENFPTGQTGEDVRNPFEVWEVDFN